MTSHDLRDRQPAAPGTDGYAAPAPGKRTLTDRLPVQRSLRGQERDVREFDSTGDYYDSRAIIDPSAQRPALLDDRQLARARRKNPRWARRMHLSTHRLSGAAVDSDDYAQAVAGKQAEAGITVDGIAGPKTIEALFGETWQPPRGGRRGHPAQVATRAASRAAADGHRFDGEDPYAMHLLEDDGADADPSVLAGPAGPATRDQG